MDGAQQHDEARHRRAVRNELRQEGNVEDPDLGIEQIGQGPPDEGRGRLSTLRRLHDEGPPRMAQHAVAHPHQIGRADPAQDGVGQGGRRKQGAKAHRHQRRPDQAAQRDAQARQRPLARPLGRRGAQHQGGVQSRRDGQQDRGRNEGDQRRQRRMHAHLPVVWPPRARQP